MSKRLEGIPGFGIDRVAVAHPDAVDEAVSRHHLVRWEEQNREKRALLWPAERKLATAVPHGDRPENPELHSM